MVDHNDSRKDSRRDRRKDNIKNQLVAIDWITKVVKGGRHMRFAVVVIVGDRKSHVGFGVGKAQKVSKVIHRAVEVGKKRMIKVPTVGTTVPHEVMGHYGSGNIVLKPTEAGSGVATGGAVRIIMDLAGTSDVTSKSLDSDTPVSVIRATMDGSGKLKVREDVLKLRESAKSLEG